MAAIASRCPLPQARGGGADTTSAAIPLPRRAGPRGPLLRWWWGGVPSDARASSGSAAAATWPTRGEAASGEAAPENPRRCPRPAYLRHRARRSLGGRSLAPGGLRREAGEQGAGLPPREPRATAEPAGPHEWDAAAAPAELAVGCAHAPPRPGHVTQAPPPPPDARRAGRERRASEGAFEKFPLVPMATLRRCAGVSEPSCQKECNTVRCMMVWKRRSDHCRACIFAYFPSRLSYKTSYLKVHFTKRLPQ